MTMSRDAAAVTLVGRAGTNPQLSFGPTGDRVNFRVVATERRFDKATDEWVDGDEFGVSVVCWKTLATAVLNTVRRGDPIIVGGRIATRRFEKDGATQYFTEVKADFVGLDVAKSGGRFTRSAMEPREAVEHGSPTGSQRISDNLEGPELDGEDRPDAVDDELSWQVHDGAAGELNGALA
jgi:single-strand DNA-binding protein